MKKATLLFRKLRTGSTFIYNDRPFRKQGDGRSVNLLNGKDCILALSDKVEPVPEKYLFRQFKIIA